MIGLPAEEVERRLGTPWFDAIAAFHQKEAAA